MAKNPNVSDLSAQFYTVGDLMGTVDDLDDLDDGHHRADSRRMPLVWLMLAIAAAVGLLLLALIAA